MREKIEEIIEQSFDVVRVGNKVYYTSKSNSDEGFKRRLEELLTMPNTMSTCCDNRTQEEKDMKRMWDEGETFR